MRYLTRNKIYKKKEPSKDAKKIYIFCEGERREVDYFKFFQGFSSTLDVIPVPNYNSKSDPIKLKENAEKIFFGDGLTAPACKLSNDLKDEIWFVIDTDRWNEGDKISSLKTFAEEKNKFYSGWFVAQSNPSFEIWLYCHFYSEKPLNDEVHKFGSFKAFVGSKIKGGFDNRSMPLEIQRAALHAETNFESGNGGQPALYSTEVFRLAKKIIELIKPQLDKRLLITKETNPSGHSGAA